MRAIINGDIIVKVITSEINGINIGDIPKGVGLERLRWDGKEIVDLSELSTIYVEDINGVNILHCKNTGNCQKIEMKYNERKRLIKKNGVIKVKTDEEIHTEKNEERIKRNNKNKRKSV